MDFQEAIAEVHRLSANGQGATDHVALDEITQGILSKMATAEREANLRHDMVLAVAERLEAIYREMVGQMQDLNHRLERLQTSVRSMRKHFGIRNG